MTVVVVGFALMATSCGDPEAKCAEVPRTEFVGRVVERHGDRVEYVIESMVPLATRPLDGTPALTAGQRVEIHYDSGIDHTAQFLHRGTRYRVETWWWHNAFRSDIRTADRACSDATTYVDGSSINTSLWARSSVRRVAYVLLVGLIVAITLVVRNTYRLRRRRRAGAA